MKIVYLTNIQTPASDAQSIQVREMAREFNGVLGKNNFLFISPLNNNNKNLETEFRWIKIKTLIKKRNFRFIELILKSLKLVFKEKPNFIFTRDILIACFYSCLGFKAVYEIHRPFENKWGEFLFKMIAGKIKVISISYNLKKFLKEKYNIDSIVFYSGVDLEKFKNIKENKKLFGLTEKDFVLLYSGSFKKGKGADLLINASKKMKDIYFVILGSDRSETKDNLIFIKRKNYKYIPQYLVSADLLVLPNNKNLDYWKYTSPLKMFEYMATSKPILTSGIGSINEVLSSNNSFIYKDEEDFTNKVKEIKYNYSLALEKAEKSYDKVSYYTWEKRVRNIIKFLCVE